MAESFKSRLTRWKFNLFPVYRRTGARLTYISGDLREVQIKLPLNWKTRNYIGTLFGGSIYAAVDPLYMVMLINILGPKYIVWDKEASIKFIKPACSTVHAKAKIPKSEIDYIRNTLKAQKKLERTYQIELTDEAGNVCAVVEKIIHFKKKE